jgi:glycosyltransferase involved in cell wall biosynthesis
MSILFQVHQYDFVFIHREASPIGPPVFEWIIAKIFRKKIIYDFDDAIWLTDKIEESSITSLLKWRSKVGPICKWSHRVSCGNEYLRAHASSFNAQTVLNPTTIDTENLHNPILYDKKQTSDTCFIGWTGSHSTLKYLTEIQPALASIAEDFPEVRFVVIADKLPDLNMKHLEFRKWSIQTEISDLATFDIGIMPLPDDEWAKGKCGFKALQYMAMEIPTVASSVGVNTTIITNNVNGFLASTPAEWNDRLRELILDKDLRKRLGQQGRSTVKESYSVLSNSATFLALFE